jgi:DNA repair photolyase
VSDVCSTPIELGRLSARIGRMTHLLEPICPTMWSVTPYDRCDFRCVYCCTSMQGVSEPTLAPDEIDAAVEAMLDQVPADDLLIFGAYSDAYPSVEGAEGLTRSILERVVELGRRFSIVTKGTAVLRDIDLLQRSPVEPLVQISICSTDEAALAVLDPGAPTGEERFAIIDELHAAGIRVELNALPYLPDVSDLEAMFARLPDGVAAVVAPLAFGDRPSLRLLGRTYRRDEVWARYLDDHRRLGHLEQTSWVQPSLPPDENHPLFRLPRPTAVER